MRGRQKGFTLIEIAIVLVIIGLLLGGVLKGQELITSARVRNLISQQDGVKAAYFGFLDRYRALPGDYTGATLNIANVAATAACGGGNGNGNGRIESAGNEHILVWEHLSKAGFINGSYTCSAPPAVAANSPANAFAVYLQLIWDFAFDDPSGPSATARHNLKTGGQIPSDLLAEVDRKNDDGSATGGTFRFSAYDGGAGIPVGAGAAGTTCYTTGTGVWNATAPIANCGAATLF